MFLNLQNVYKKEYFEKLKKKEVKYVPSFEYGNFTNKK